MKLHEHPRACSCTKVMQDPSCPVGYPSALCVTCDGVGLLPTNDHDPETDNGEKDMSKNTAMPRVNATCMDCRFFWDANGLCVRYPPKVLVVPVRSKTDQEQPYETAPPTDCSLSDWQMKHVVSQEPWVGADRPACGEFRYGPQPTVPDVAEGEPGWDERYD